MDPATALAPREPDAAVSLPIHKPLPPQHFVDHGTNAEMRWDAVAGLGYTTPNERFYVRSHFATPAVDPKAYRLVVEGHVENRLELSLDEVKTLAPVTAPLTLECAGNSRVFLAPAVRGLQWGHGAVGTADWTGTPLGALLHWASISAFVRPWRSLAQPWASAPADTARAASIACWARTTAD